MNNNNTAFIKRTKSVEHSKKLDNSMNKRSMSDKHQTRSKIIIPGALYPLAKGAL